jgi:hypothetical protein
LKQASKLVKNTYILGNFQRQTHVFTHTSMCTAWFLRTQPLRVKCKLPGAAFRVVRCTARVRAFEGGVGGGGDGCQWGVNGEKREEVKERENGGGKMVCVCVCVFILLFILN